LVSKIALEEHFLCPGFEGYWATTVGGVAPEALQKIKGRLSDFDDSRIEAMDGAGIAKAVLSLAGPGVQIEPDRATAIKLAIQANDFLAKELQKRPDRYAGFGHLAMQDASAAADELERCMRDLGFRGVMINGHTNGQYLDHPSLAPFWERAAALRAPVYIHPGDPVALSPVLDGHPALRRATWEWGFETGSHALRLVFGGVFARYPDATVILGHLGETLPYLLWRFDSRAKLYGVELPRPPSAYIRSNIAVTTSGMFSAEPLNCAIAAIGHERVMFSSDYPFEAPEEAGRFMDQVALPEDVRAAIAFNNAKRILNL
jgi:2,3-dihydroxybenzoate decarboxylase